MLYNMSLLLVYMYLFVSVNPIPLICPSSFPLWGFPGGSVVKTLPSNAGGAVQGRSPGGGNGNPLYDSCLGNPMDKEALLGYTVRSVERVSPALAS